MRKNPQKRGECVPVRKTALYILTAAQKCGVMEMKNSKLMPGMGRERTDR